MKTHKFSAPTTLHEGAGKCLHGAGSLGGGFNLAKIDQVGTDWSLDWRRTGGTGNHGVAAVVPKSEAAKAVSDAISDAFFRGLFAAVEAAGWDQAVKVVAGVVPPVGAERSGIFSLYAHGGGVRFNWTHPDVKPFAASCAYFRLESRYSSALPGVGDVPRYVWTHLDGGDEGCLAHLCALGIMKMEMAADYN